MISNSLFEKISNCHGSHSSTISGVTHVYLAIQAFLSQRVRARSEIILLKPARFGAPFPHHPPLLIYLQPLKAGYIRPCLK